MEVKELLPIGSVARVKGGQRKVMIIGVKQRNTQTKELYDYLAIPYPEGYMSKELTFFINHDAFEEVCFRGFENEEREKFLNSLENFYKDKEKSNE